MSRELQETSGSMNGVVMETLYNIYAFERVKDFQQVLGEQKGKRKHIQGELMNGI